jgi:hypothetical protein
MAYGDYIGNERGERGDRGRGRGERGERGRSGWGGSWGSWGGWPYGYAGYAGYPYGYGYPTLDLPAGRVIGPDVVLLGQEAGLPPGPPPGMNFPFPPRAAVVAAPMPTQANRDILPMSTGVPILPTQSAQITGRPQTLVFKIGRFVISNAGTAGGAADWIVNDIKIGNRSQFVQSGDVPGDLFATNAIDTFVRFESAQTAMDVVVVVTYIGLNESGAPFFGAMVGTAAI